MAMPGMAMRGMAMRGMAMRGTAEALKLVAASTTASILVSDREAQEITAAKASQTQLWQMDTAGVAHLADTGAPHPDIISRNTPRSVAYAVTIAVMLGIQCHDIERILTSPAVS